jgi:hypothetical protein
MSTENCPNAIQSLKINQADLSGFVADYSWLNLIRQMDVILRRRQNIFEFCSDPHCLLRIALCPATGEELPCGICLQNGDLIGELHLWNEHIPPLPAGGPSFAWAGLIRQRTSESFALLAESVRSDSRFKNVRLFRARTRLGGDQPRHFERLMRSFGFERVEELTCSNWREQLTGLGECLHLWTLLCAFNPVALTNHRLIELPFRQLWMSRETLLAKYPVRSHFLAAAPLPFNENDVSDPNPIPVTPLPSENALA